MMITNAVSHLREAALDVLYPPTCVRCERDGSWMCEECLAGLAFFHGSMCPRCGSFERREHVCEGVWPFASVTSAGSYANLALRTLLLGLKYRSATCLEEPLRLVLKTFRESFQHPWPWANLSELAIVSIPGDPHRIQRRGLDHAALLARLVRETLVPWATPAEPLVRVRFVAPNATLPADRLREMNVRGAFISLQPLRMPVLLIDDVLTTGATASEAARTLLQAGATEVHVLTIARGG